MSSMTQRKTTNQTVIHTQHVQCWFESFHRCVFVFQLTRIEAELRESLRLDIERQKEAEFLRQQENKQLRTNLCFLSLGQRVAK